MTRYEHTQIGHVIIWSLVAVILIANGGLMESWLITGRHWSFRSSCWFASFFSTNSGLRSTLRLCCASFGLGVIRKKVRLAEIVGCEPIRIRWWYGWGIHLTPYGCLYNVSGFDAVAITLRDGRKFALGTDDPHGLTAGIRDAIRVN